MRKNIRLTLPLLMGYIPLSIAFAVAWLQAGLPVWGALLTSIILYAGSMQFLLIGLLATDVGLDTILLATLAVNLRHIFYGLSFPTAPFRGHPLALGYSIFALTDEGYSAISTIDTNDRDSYRSITACLAILQGSWVFGTTIGLVAGSLLPNTVIGFDFALCGVFLVLAQNHYYRRERRPAMALGFLGIIVALIAVHGFAVDKQKMLAIAIGVLTVLLFVLPRDKVLIRSAA